MSGVLSGGGGGGSSSFPQKRFCECTHLAIPFLHYLLHWQLRNRAFTEPFAFALCARGALISLQSHVVHTKVPPPPPPPPPPMVKGPDIRASNTLISTSTFHAISVLSKNLAYYAPFMLTNFSTLMHTFSILPLKSVQV